ncbi:hypothetical protein ACF3DV_07640 [Chlorogloeopsis fritschii PCC 9212]|uniref:DUF4870 domain-containing protein n=1 Tax=Chlorogloeopsis fritschii PCC 6912 TaxID=211165 RepID=A0A433N7H6_CHLFR|nr:hypothetical protein [Chlorogloeopsis fritschii]MBF2008831.1 hypothetical protein [Chlorogloeopsis fritschii C42_A2020_084]RUR77485.1 hypothetical protein PCC6912_38760 [Chlorogloeopsis fritschii PCC 6912]
MNHFERINDYEGQEDAENEEDTGTRERGDAGSIFGNFPPSPTHPLSHSSSPIELILYLIPIIGFFPSLWTLYHRQGSQEQLATCRLSITLAVSWVLGYLFLATGAASLDFVAVRLLILNSFLTSGYFLVSLWLIFLIVRRKSRRLPGLNYFAEKVIGKYLS